MSLLILTGPAGSGKNTISEVLAKKRQKCVVIDIDMVRHMVKNPHVAPWYEEGITQMELGIKNGCMLAKSLIEEGFDVVILDVVSEGTAKLDKENLGVINYKTALLLPTYEEVVERNASRSYQLKADRVEALYKMQQDLKDVDYKIDNTNLTVEETADKLNSLF